MIDLKEYVHFLVKWREREIERKINTIGKLMLIDKPVSSNI